MVKLDRMALDELRNPTPGRLADAVLQQLAAQFPSLPIPIPIEDIAAALDIVSIEALTSTGFEGALLIRDGAAVILVNGANSPDRQRFTIGHELGHWLNPWHLLGANTIECGREQMRLFSATVGITQRERIEIEANLFSAELLLPEKPFKHDLRTEKEPSLHQIVALAMKYGMSKLATARRYVTLSDHACALVVSRDNQIQQIYRNKDFPALALKSGMGLPLSGLPPAASADALKCTMHPVSSDIWCREGAPTGAVLHEQALLQANGYRLTLLYWDDSQCPDDDQTYEEDRSAWRPTFRR